MKIRKLLALGALLCVLAGCAGNPLPDGMKEEDLLAAGRQVLKLAVAEEYEELHGLLRQDVRDSVTAEQIRDLVVSQTASAGDYRQIEDSMVTGQSAQGEEFGVAVLYCEYSGDDVLFRISFDSEMNLIGLSVQKQ